MAIRFDKGRAVAALLIVGGIITAAYGAALFTQNIPSVDVKSAAEIQMGCGSPTAKNLPVENTSGNIRFSCAGVALAAFSAAIRQVSTGTVMATFSLTGTGYSSLGLAQYVAGATDCTPSITLVSDIPMLLSAGDYDYCATYTTTPAAGEPIGSAFNVSWSTP
jgi:uncharacterized membrane protein YidH (DUF202 family)